MDKDAFNIDYIKLRVEFEILQDCQLARYKAYGLKRNIEDIILKDNCIEEEGCSSCKFNESCIVLDTIGPKDSPQSPFIIECFDERRFLNRGDGLEFHFTLFGQAIVNISQFIYAFDLAGELGLGNRDNLFRLKGIYGQEAIVYKDGFFHSENIPVENLRDYIGGRKIIIKGMKFISPFRFEKADQLTDRFKMDDILKALRARLALLSGCPANAFKEDLGNIQGEIQGTYREWTDIKRYRDRGEDYIALGGIIGDLYLPEGINSIRDYVIAGELVHIGENTSFGLGKFQIL